MKTSIKNLFLLPALIAGLNLIPAGRVTAQTFTTLHSFAYFPGDGGWPYAGLILSGNTLYGAAYTHGSWNGGTVFAVNTDGTVFTNLYNFTGGSDGYWPYGGLILSGNTLYGAASAGGSGGNGTVFKVNTNGTGFTILHSFTASANSINSDGAWPYAGLILSGNTLYGTTLNGGSGGKGTVFAVNTDGTGFTTLHSFTAVLNSTNSDGADPEAGLILSGNTLYGTAFYGGSGGNGTVFKVNTNGTGFTILHSFTASANSINSDGAWPYAGLILSGNTLYGTAVHGGSSGNGTVFAVHTDGTGFTNLHSFTVTASSSPHNNSDGANPWAGLILSGNTLYGTASYGGSSGNGTVFALKLPTPPSIGITTTGNQIVLSWPTNAAGYALQSIANLSSGSWSNVTSGITIVGTNYVFSSTMSGKAAFFRLTQ
jgi:uncharacterized repeat protein (TIGR03803 family)